MSSLFTRTAGRASRRAAASSTQQQQQQQAVRHASTSASGASTTTYAPTLSISLGRLSLKVDFPVPALLSQVAEATRSEEVILPVYALAGQRYGPAEEAGPAAEEDPLKWDGFLNAVPKSRVSHSRKRMRSANKGLKDRIDLVHCSACGTPKLYHHLCRVCFSDISKRQKVTFDGEERLARLQEAIAPKLRAIEEAKLNKLRQHPKFAKREERVRLQEEADDLLAQAQAEGGPTATVEGFLKRQRQREEFEQWKAQRIQQQSDKGDENAAERRT